jgi:hypothetical protein
MRRAWLLTAALACAPLALVSAQSPGAAEDLKAVLAQVGASVHRYYARARSIICIETVTLQPLSYNLSADTNFARKLQYELRVAWEPGEDGRAGEASVQRQLIKVNNRAPRPKDKPGCLDPRDVSPEPLSMLLPAGQQDYTFTLAGRGKVNGRPALLLDFRARAAGPISATWQEDCFSLDIPGRSRGRVWIDPQTGDVLRLDERLTGMIDFTLPPAHREPGGPNSITIERLDSSIVYRPVTFDDPEETLLVPSTVDTVTIIRNSGTPRLRTTRSFTNYRRFVTAGRILQND